MFFFKQQHKIKWLPIIIILAIFFILFFLALSGLLLFENKYAKKIYPGITIGNVPVSGFTINQTKQIINQEIDKLKENGFKFIYEDKIATLYPLVSSLESDMAYEIINFNTEESILKAYHLGRENNFFHNLLLKWHLFRKKTTLSIDISFNKVEIEKFLEDNFNKYSKPAQDAKLKYENYKYKIWEEKFGKTIDFEIALNKLQKNLSVMDNSDIVLQTKIDEPKILKQNCLNIEAKANKFLETAPLTLVFEKQQWTITKDQARSWLNLKSINVEETSNPDTVYVGLNFENVEKYLLKEIAPKINQEPIDAKFEIKDGKVAEFQASLDGLTLDVIKSFRKIEQAFTKPQENLAEEKNIVELVVLELKSELNTSSINDFGIKEIIGTGHSNFSGSPKNRRHNIRTGAEAVNGTLIKPGGEFSLIKTLGEINKESGYLPELVIKENKTIPEYGGGLCQIGTTLFRATTESGMPVTMRRNHSYRVSYYEPAGTDATIYDPWPDYRFKNDSTYHILIQYRIEGDDLYFDFWSTEDGRLATSTYPTIYNITRPGPTKIIETTELEPGIKKCTEHAHNGADAYFDYSIIYDKNNLPADFELKEDEDITKETLTKTTRFSSHYVPWKEVCLLGVEEISTSTEEQL